MDMAAPDTMDMPMTDMKSDADSNDLIPPQITMHTPADGSADVALDAMITVTFNEPVLEATITNNDNFFVSSPGNDKVPGTIVWNESALTATMTLDAPLISPSLHSSTLPLLHAPYQELKIFENYRIHHQPDAALQFIARYCAESKSK